MKKSLQRSPAPSSLEALVVQATEALRQERFKEAVEFFKRAVRQDPRPEWKHSLVEAYHGRARALAAKRMFKEAAIVLENTLAADGRVADPLFYLHCLIRDGQQQKAAAHALLYVGQDNALPEDQRAVLEDLTAALLIAAPLRPAPARPIRSEHARWLELAAASREALDAWVNDASAEEMERLLGRISLRSAFRPVRLLLKSLLAQPQEAEHSRRLLDAIGPHSAFSGLRDAVEAAVSGEGGMDAGTWHRLTPGQQAFVVETRGLPASASQFLARSAEAARGGVATLFAFLLKQTDLPQAEVRSACLNLLPHVTDRLPQFEKTFGPPSALERQRIHALAAEARGEWRNVERFWNSAVEAISDGERQAGLMRGVILRHLADLALRHPQIEGDPGDPFSDPATAYLERSCEADPDHVPAVLELIGRYRADGRDKDWHRLAEEAAQRFPDTAAILQQATESAVARRAYKKAAGFAGRLLAIDPINAGVRRQMVQLQLAHARKQMRANRPDLAVRELATAAEWERPDAPDAPLWIARGLVGLQIGEGEPAEAQLRGGVALAGGAVPGWFRAALEAELMRVDVAHADRLRKELTRAREAPPTREAVMALVATLGQPEASENAKVIAGLLLGLRTWLERAASFDWPPAEFQALADILARFAAFDLLEAYARAAHRRGPASATARFYQIVARTRGNADRLSIAETDELAALAHAAAGREEFHAASRIERFLDGQLVAGPGRRRPRRDPADDLDDATVHMLAETMVNDMPKGAVDGVRAIVKELGREAAILVLVEQLRASPLGPEMPEPLLRELCETMVARTVAGPAPPRGGAPRRGRP